MNVFFLNILDGSFFFYRINENERIFRVVSYTWLLGYFARIASYRGFNTETNCLFARRMFVCLFARTSAILKTIWLLATLAPLLCQHTHIHTHIDDSLVIGITTERTCIMRTWLSTFCSWSCKVTSGSLVRDFLFLNWEWLAAFRGVATLGWARFRCRPRKSEISEIMALSAGAPRGGGDRQQRRELAYTFGFCFWLASFGFF